MREVTILAVVSLLLILYCCRTTVLADACGPVDKFYTADGNCYPKKGYNSPCVRDAECQYAFNFFRCADGKCGCKDGRGLEANSKLRYIVTSQREVHVKIPKEDGDEYREVTSNTRVIGAQWSKPDTENDKYAYVLQNLTEPLIETGCVGGPNRPCNPDRKCVNCWSCAPDQHCRSQTRSCSATSPEFWRDVRNKDFVTEFDDRTGDEVWLENPTAFVMLYAGWCPLSRKAAHDFADAAKKFKGKVSFVAVDCEKMKQPCQNLHYLWYPTFILYKNSTSVGYYGSATTEEFTEFIRNDRPDPFA